MSKSRVFLAQVVALVVVAVGFCPAAVHAANYLHLSDVHLDTSGASKDTDLGLWKITKEELRAILTGPDAPSFVLYTGDLPGHYEAAPCRCDGGLAPSQVPAHDENVRKVLADLHDLVADTGIPLLYTPGNNDSLAGDYFSFTDSDGETPFSLVSADDGYPALNASTPCGDAPCLVSNPRPELGFYSARPVAGLRVIVLNTIIMSRKYRQVDGFTQTDAGDAQLDWLAGQLEDASRAGEKALLALHIPPGRDAYAVSEGRSDTSMWTRCPDGGQPGGSEAAWLDRFLDLVAAHSATVVGLAYGHTHEDELRRLHDRSGNVTEIAVSAPGITTTHGNNPGFKRVTYDPETKELLGFETFYTHSAKRDWSSWGDEYYTFSELYGCADGSTILECLTSPGYADTAAVDRILRSYYTVMNGPPSVDPGTAIEVERGQ